MPRTRIGAHHGAPNLPAGARREPARFEVYGRRVVAATPVSEFTDMVPPRETRLYYLGLPVDLGR